VGAAADATAASDPTPAQASSPDPNAASSGPAVPATPSAVATALPSGSAPVPSAPPPSSLAPPKVNGLTWKPMGRKVRKQHPVWVAQTGHGSIGMMWMNPALLRFRYIPGYNFPESGPVRRIDNKPSTWTSRMVAAFNGAFQLKDGAGGYYYDHKTVRPLRNGLSSIVIDRQGRLTVVDWRNGNHVPAGTRLVRQNMKPLVLHSQARAKSGDARGTWGQADHGLPHANRSALGELADGSLVFAYGSEVSAPAMAQALAGAGAETAIILDMNKSWPTGFVYDAPKGSSPPVGHRIQPSIWRDASAYLHRFQKDFFVALTRPAKAPAN